MMKFADSVVAVSTLLYENILEHSSKHFRKKFRQYLQALRYWREQLNISDQNILDYINQYLYLEYDSENFVEEKKYNKILNQKQKKHRYMKQKLKQLFLIINLTIKHV